MIANIISTHGKKVKCVYLSEEEIKAIINKDFKTKKPSLVRDIILFSCFSGKAYIDVKNLTKWHISIDGEKNECFLNISKAN